MIIDVNNSDAVTRNLDAKIYYKRSEENEYQLYKERLNFEIYSDSDNDTIIVPIGASNTLLEQTTNNELEYGEYDFRVDIFETGKEKLLAFQDMENPLLSKQKFETEEEDSYYFTISNIWWSDSVDLDGDFYTSARKINFDVNVDKDVQQTLYAKIYMRIHEENSDSNDYDITYDSTDNFSIFGSNNDPFSTWIRKDTTALDSNKYDILISVYSNSFKDTIDYVAVTISGCCDTLLTNQKFETESQDSL